MLSVPNAPFPAALLLLSWRGLFLRPARTLLTIASVAVAMASLVLFLSLGAGLRQLVSGQTNSIRAQLQISRTGGLPSLLPTPELPQATPIVLQGRTLGNAARIGFRYTLYAIPADAGFERVYPYARAATGRTLRHGDPRRRIRHRSAGHRAASVRPDRIDFAGGRRNRGRLRP